MFWRLPRPYSPACSTPSQQPSVGMSSGKTRSFSPKLKPYFFGCVLLSLPGRLAKSPRSPVPSPHAGPALSRLKVPPLPPQARARERLRLCGAVSGTRRALGGGRDRGRRVGDVAAGLGAPGGPAAGAAGEGAFRQNLPGLRRDGASRPRAGCAGFLFAQSRQRAELTH